ncbi:MAG: hypothetical protein OEW00_04605 [candidate division Zixibacteria bacterium]|nr:hypothetical protein [candidate division Zixibacteria bacterium]
MKKLILLGMLVMLVAPGADARRKSKKAGEVDGLTYIDNNFDFKLTLSDGWKYKIGKNKDNYRLVLTQKNYQIPPDYIDAPDYTKVPRIVVFVDTCALGPLPFIDSLLNDNYSTGQKKEILKEFEIFHDYSEGRQEVVPRQRKPITVNDQKGVLWTGKGIYVKEVSMSSSSTTDAGKRVTGAYGGAVAVIKKGDILVAFHVMCEWDFFPAVLDELMAMVNSLEFFEEAGG